MTKKISKLRQEIEEQAFLAEQYDNDEIPKNLLRSAKRKLRNLNTEAALLIQGQEPRGNRDNA